MTREEVVKQAAWSGYAEVETAGGWIPITGWYPLGDHRLHYRIEPHKSRICAQRGRAQVIIQVWPLRKGFRRKSDA